MRLGPLRLGRFSGTQTAKFGAALGPVGYFAVGPVAVLVALPVRWQKAEAAVLSLADLNAHLRRVSYLKERFGLPAN